MLLEFKNESQLNIVMKKIYNVFLAALIASAGMALGQTQEQRIEALEKQLMELKGQAAKPDYLKQAASHGLTFGFYGEFKWINKNHGNDKFDPHRFVLIPHYKLSDYAKFVAEIEIEHGGLKGDGDGSSDKRFDGELELEQFYVDAEINDWATWRAGISLIPVGRVNQHHEPDQFYSVHRPIMYKRIIPSTWMESGMGFHGDIPSVDGLGYELFLSQGLTSTYATHTDGNWNPRSTRPNPRESDGNDSLAASLKLSYEKGGFAGSVSTYQTSYECSNGSSDLGLYDIEASYLFGAGSSLAGIELIADYATWDISDPANIVGAGATQTGDEMDGYRLEVAYHMPQGDNELIPFFRAEGYDLESGPQGSSSNYLTYGAMYKFGDNWEIKGGVRQSLDDDQSTEYTLGVGIQF